MEDAKGKEGAVVEKDTKEEVKKDIDPNQRPRLPQSAFFIFLDEFRKSFKEAHPEYKGVTLVVKAAGEKWKEMSDSEKVPYHTEAARRKTEYEKALAAYKQKQDEEAGDEGTPEESDKSKSEINNEEESGDEEDDEQAGSVSSTKQ